MKHMNFICFAVLATMFFSCQMTQKNDGLYCVRGELADSSSNGKMIYIMRYDDQKLLDSTLVTGKNFVFEGKVDTPAFCRIDVTGREFANLILEEGNIRVDLVNYNQPSGTPQNGMLAKIDSAEHAAFDNIQKLREEYLEKYPDKDEFDKEWAKVNEEDVRKRNKLSEDWYKCHADDAVGYYLLHTIFFRSADIDFREKIVANLGDKLKSTRLVRDIVKGLKAQRMTEEGKPFADIKGVDKNGKPVSLSDYVGKGNYVLMDMWSTWCGPCKEEIPNLALLHDKYKDKDLVVLGMFVWDKADNLSAFLDKEGISWPQIIDKENVAMDTYGTNGIPFIVLFAPDGTILKRDLRRDNMIRTIDKYMNGKVR